jgi:hypothetical protein
MVGDGFDARLLALFGKVVQEEVDEDGVDFGLGGKQQDLAAQELDGPDAAAWKEGGGLARTGKAWAGRWQNG